MLGVSFGLVRSANSRCQSRREDFWEATSFIQDHEFNARLLSKFLSISRKQPTSFAGQKRNAQTVKKYPQSSLAIDGFLPKSTNIDICEETIHHRSSSKAPISRHEVCKHVFYK
jgi:hypothetical protein